MKIQLNFETVQPGFVLILGPTKKYLRIKFMAVPPKYIYINIYIYKYIPANNTGLSLGSECCVHFVLRDDVFNSQRKQRCKILRYFLQ